jgi:hypothetical protein
MKALISIVLLAVCVSGRSQSYDTNGDYVQTFAGSGFHGYLDGQGTQTMFYNPNMIVGDFQSNLFVWDSGNFRIRKISPNGTVTTFAGGGSQSTGIGTNVNLTFNTYGIAMTIDHNDTIWIIMGLNIEGETTLVLYQITSGAVITYTNLSLTSQAQGICADSIGNIYFSCGNQVFRYSTNGIVSVFAGSGNSGYANGNGIFTSFYSPQALAADEANNIYVWDMGNNLIRRIDQSQNVTTIAGEYQNSYGDIDGASTNSAFNSIYQMSYDNSGNLYLACGTCIRKITPTMNVVTMAGSFTQTGYTNGAGNLARFNSSFGDSVPGDGVCMVGGAIYIADSGNERIRKISFNPQAQNVASCNLSIGTFAGITVTGIIGRTYQIQSSPDMNTWTTQATVVLTTSPYVWIDPTEAVGSRYYRAFLLP